MWNWQREFDFKFETRLWLLYDVNKADYIASQYTSVRDLPDMYRETNFKEGILSGCVGDWFKKSRR